MQYREALARLQERDALPLFAEKPWDPELERILAGADGASLFAPHPLRDRSAAECARAGLLLLNDGFEAAHRVCQEIHDATGSYWHQLCHRREGDAGSGLAANLSNTRYWIRSTGSHPAYPEVREAVLAALSSCPQEGWTAAATAEVRASPAWVPERMVQWVGDAGAHRLDPAAVAALCAAQRAEILALLGWCECAAVGLG